LGRFCSDSRFKFYGADITNDVSLMEDLYREHDVILPLVGLVGAPVCESNQHMAWLLNHASVVDMAFDMKGLGKKIVYPCTNSGYGSRPDGTPVTEEDPLNPISVYGKSKVAAESVILAQGGVSLRLATVMGWSPCMRMDLLVNTFVWKAVKERSITLFEKDMKRNYIHVEDVANAFIFAINNYDKMKGQAYNIGLSDANLSKYELAQQIAKHTECHIVEAEFMQDPDKRDYIVSNEKIEALGFKPKWSLDDTIRQLIEFYYTIDLSSSNVFFDNW
jgi:nucleoside-diphosphate-sugar epimerase